MTEQDQPLPVPSRRVRFFFAGKQIGVAQEVQGGEDVGDLGGVRIGRREAVLDYGERELRVLEHERDEIGPKVGFVLWLRVFTGLSIFGSPASGIRLDSTHRIAMLRLSDSA